VVAGEERLLNGMGRSTDGASGVKRPERPRTDGKEARATSPRASTAPKNSRSSRKKKEPTGRKTARRADPDRNGRKRSTAKNDLTGILAGKDKDLGSQSEDLAALLNRVLGILLDDDRVQSALYDVRLLVTALQETSLSAAHQKQAPATESDTASVGEIRSDLAYEACVRRIREVVRTTVPEDGIVIVVSKGDEDLLDLYGREAWHFPPDPNGDYAPQYPTGATATIAHLETLRAEGADYFLVPKPIHGWLQGHPKFSQHLSHHYPVAVQEDETCTIFELKKSRGARASSWWAQLSDLISEHRDQLDRDPAILDWHTGLEVKEHFPDETVFQPPGHEVDLPYFDQSVDIVLVATPEASALREARRVAAYAVATFAPVDATFADADAERWEEDFVMSIEHVRKQSPRLLPSTSIIIPTCNGHDHLRSCLIALEETLPDPFRGEVVVVDDASASEVTKVLRALIRGSRLQIKVLRNQDNRGFVASCNHGARNASGDILVFLNDDTLPQHDWLPPLLRVFREYEDAGAAGGRLVYPDGRLQEAGNVIFSNGSGANFGRGDHVDAPLYKYVREVDYCSGALLATPRELFLELEGFDERYRPAYYEDADYGFTLRERGKRVYYQPESIVVHVEGATGGTDVTSGVKKYQSLNKVKFVEKWASALRAQPDPPGDYGPRTWHMLAARHGGD
jgi:GT2 family glycosyltransferase